MRALHAALGAPWAIQATALEEILTIAAREHEVSREALEAYRAQALLRSERMDRRGSVGILNIEGPLFRRANLFTEYSGATSYDIVRRDLQVALDEDGITSILLNIDSPGGMVNGCGELADAVRDATKPVVAYVGGTAASAAYWIASAADEIVTDRSATLGSIGCIVGITDYSDQDRAKGVKRFDFVSSQSPKKRSDPNTDAGASELQRMADEAASVFIAAVAENRGVSVDTVVADFGNGGVLIGERAVAVGMADRLGSFEETIARMARGDARPRSRSARRPVGAPPILRNQNKDRAMSQDNAADAATAHANATARIKTIMQAPEAAGRKDLAEHLAFNTTMDAEAAVAIMKAAPAGGDLDEPDRPPNGAGLGINYASAPRRESSLVAAMKQRHGVK